MTVPESQSLSYSQEDIQQILQRAIARQAYEGEFTREQLLEIAEELEISAECLTLAEQDWQVHQLQHQQRQAFDTYRQGKFKQKLGKYVIVNSFLVGLNVLTAGTLSWSMYIVLFWGAGVSWDGWKTYQSDGEAYEQSFQKWNRKHQLKQAVNVFWNKLQKALLT